MGKCKKTNGRDKKYKYYGLDSTGNIWMGNDISLLHEAGYDVYEDYHDALMAKIRQDRKTAWVAWEFALAVFVIAVLISFILLVALT